jgi:hypothetical protein
VTVLAPTWEGRIQKINSWNPDSEPVAGYLVAKSQAVTQRKLWGLQAITICE